MQADRNPNILLRALLAESGWTYEQLARTVNQLGAENRIRLYYDRTAVAHWTAGTTPRSTTRVLIAEAFTRRLGRRVTPVDVGFDSGHLVLAAPTPAAHGVTGAPGGAGTTGAAERLSALCHLETDPTRRPALRQFIVKDGHPPLSLPAAPLPEQGVRHVLRQWCPDADKVMVLREAVGFFHSAHQFGGGHARTALAAYLGHAVVGWLSLCPSQREHVDLLTGAAHLAHLLACMYSDEELNGVAQQHAEVALDLAVAARNRCAYVVVLSGMSVHALDLGHRRRALSLARAATRSSHVDVPSGVRSLSYGQLARAQAAMGNRQEAMDSLRAADEERRCEPSGGSADAFDVYRYSAADASRRYGQVLAATGDPAGAVTALRRSLELRPSQELLARTMTLYEIGCLQVRLGRLEEAGTSWHQFLDVLPLLRSRRAACASAELGRLLRSHPGAQPARSVLARMETR
ncbi:hypothetical protein [Streptomyces sp. NRRL S-1521]|uniref:hypothetical protein n=1 Tax=Streptomyces sp. NRRL S-1521 TaxID=1609100 RepID=UPI00074A1D26|nr:hypothetical protein [Streptomyces sp. NRRL S-1521]KUL53157.1 hypothetical protein ADL30_20630 [Streptomyces sp. NRRL S-1521]